MPTKKAQKSPNFHPRHALRSRAGCRGDRGLSATATACQSSSLSRVRRNSSLFPPNQRHIHLVEVKYREDTRPRSQLEAAHQRGALCQHLNRAAANVSLHTFLLRVGGTIHSPYSSEPLKRIGLDPQKATKLCCEASCSFGSTNVKFSMLINLLVPCN